MDFNNATTQTLVDAIIDGSGDDLFVVSNRLANINTDEVRDKMVELLQNPREETRYLASRTLGKMENSQEALVSLLEILEDNNYPYSKGDLAEALLEMDCSEKFVSIFKLYLFGSVKLSSMAKLVLDSEDFNITPRTIRKAEKHWIHFTNNTSQDDGFEIKKEEIEGILNELKSLFSEE